MNLEIILKLLPRPEFIIFISTFAGALAGEFYREANDDTPCSFAKFISKFFASWMIGFATMLLFQSTFDIGRTEMLAALSIVFGFIGHKDSILFAKNIINSKFKS